MAEWRDLADLLQRDNTDPRAALVPSLLNVWLADNGAVVSLQLSDHWRQNVPIETVCEYLQRRIAAIESEMCRAPLTSEPPQFFFSVDGRVRLSYQAARLIAIEVDPRWAQLVPATDIAAAMFEAFTAAGRTAAIA